MQINGMSQWSQRKQERLFIHMRLQMESRRVLLAWMVKSMVELAAALLSGDVDAMLLNEAFLDTLEETDGLTNLSDQVKLIHEFYYAQEPEQVVPANTNVLTDSYIIYLSGSDARSTDVPLPTGCGTINSPGLRMYPSVPGAIRISWRWSTPPPTGSCW